MPIPSQSVYFWESAEVVVPPDGPVETVVRNFEGVTVNCQVQVR